MKDRRANTFICGFSLALLTGTGTHTHMHAHPHTQIYHTCMHKHCTHYYHHHSTAHTYHTHTRTTTHKKQTKRQCIKHFVKLSILKQNYVFISFKISNASRIKGLWLVVCWHLFLNITFKMRWLHYNIPNHPASQWWYCMSY